MELPVCVCDEFEKRNGDVGELLDEFKVLEDCKEFR
jgi:hypothetical protein